MNFVGHACAAAWADPDPRFALGAMLPDFATMAGQRLGADAIDRLGGVVRAGVAWHHRTDAAFHDCAAFASLCDDGRAALAGIGRGPALAVSHVGVELLLDGELSEDDATHAHYRAALDCGHGLDAPLRSVLDRLVAAGRPTWYRDVDGVTDRLARIFHARPRLAIATPDLPAVRAWLTAVQPRVREVAPTLLAELRGRLLG